MRSNDEADTVHPLVRPSLSGSKMAKMVCLSLTARSLDLAASHNPTGAPATKMQKAHAEGGASTKNWVPATPSTDVQRRLSRLIDVFASLFDHMEQRTPTDLHDAFVGVTMLQWFYA